MQLKLKSFMKTKADMVIIYLAVYCFMQHYE